MRKPLQAGLLAVLALPAVAHASATIRAEPSNRYATTEVTIAPGESVTFQNADAVKHDVTSRQSKADGKPLFASEIQDGGQSGEVAGTADLQPGQYEFYCSLHASSMKGTLTVTGDPAPTPTPTVTATPEADTTPPEVTLSGRLRARTIRRRDRIGLRIRANEDVELTLVARVGRRRVGRVTLDLALGRHRVSIPVTRGRAVRRGRRLRLYATAVDAAGNRRRTKLVVKLP